MGHRRSRRAQQPIAIAAFNSGFKMDSARGGAYLDGDGDRARSCTGAASFVINKDGTATVGVWGRDFTMTPDVGRSARTSSCSSTTGSSTPRSQENDTTRVRRHARQQRATCGARESASPPNGALVYAGGPALSVLSLAKTLQNAGAVRAMELDINTDWVSAYTYVRDDPANPTTPIDRHQARRRHVARRRPLPPAGERDFFAFFADPKVAVAA